MSDLCLSKPNDFANYITPLDVSSIYLNLSSRVSSFWVCSSSCRLLTCSSFTSWISALMHWSLAYSYKGEKKRGGERKGERVCVREKGLVRELSLSNWSTPWQKHWRHWHLERWAANRHTARVWALCLSLARPCSYQLIHPPSFETAVLYWLHQFWGSWAILTLVRQVWQCLT